jgi:hypothetical protein
MDPKTLNKLKFHLNRIVQGLAESPEEDWAKLEELVPLALSQAVDGAGVALHKLLEQQAERLASRRLVDNVHALQLELERVAKSGAHRPAAAAAALTPAQQVAELVRDRTMLIVGGVSRPDHAERLRAAFELREVLWPVSSKVNPSAHAFEPYLLRADLALVLMLIRFIRHGVNWDLPDLCKHHGKPLVRVPGGYNVEQVAPLILDQVGKRLGG